MSPRRRWWSTVGSSFSAYRLRSAASMPASVKSCDVTSRRQILRSVSCLLPGDFHVLIAFPAKLLPTLPVRCSWGRAGRPSRAFPGRADWPNLVGTAKAESSGAFPQGEPLEPVNGCGLRSQRCRPGRDWGASSLAHTALPCRAFHMPRLRGWSSFTSQPCTLALRSALSSRFISRSSALHHPLGLVRPVHHQVGMQAAEGFSHVAVPADRLVRGEDVGKLLRAELPPLGGLGIWS
jgi:hypothetical protein